MRGKSSRKNGLGLNVELKTKCGFPLLMYTIPHNFLLQHSTDVKREPRRIMTLKRIFENGSVGRRSFLKITTHIR